MLNSTIRFLRSVDKWSSRSSHEVPVLFIGSFSLSRIMSQHIDSLFLYLSFSLPLFLVTQKSPIFKSSRQYRRNVFPAVYPTASFHPYNRVLYLSMSAMLPSGFKQLMICSLTKQYGQLGERAVSSNKPVAQIDRVLFQPIQLSGGAAAATARFLF